MQTTVPDTNTSSAPGSTSTPAKLRAISTELADLFFERDDVIRTLLVSILARQHSLLLGPPGTAKSELARHITGRISDAQYWEILLGKYTVPTRMFGPPDVGALARGEYRQIYEGRATKANIAFMDEIFKCGVAALNETLAFLNERIYHPENGGKRVHCPLISAVTASNELSSEDDAKAIYDRLLVRMEIGYLADPSNFAALVRSVTAPAVPATRTTVDLVDLQHAVDAEVPATGVPEGIVDAICTLRAALRHHKLVCSDRRWGQSVRLLQGSAYFDGRSDVNDTDLSVLRHVLWDSPAEKPTVEREVLTLVNPDAKEALDIAEGIDQIEDQLNSKIGQSAESLGNWAVKEAVSKLKRADKRLAEMRADAVAAGRSTATLDDVIGRQRAVNARVINEAIGLPISSAADQMKGA